MSPDGCAPNRVKVAQERDAHLLVRDADVLEDPLDHDLRRAVRVRRAANRHVLAERHRVVAAVHRPRKS